MQHALRILAGNMRDFGFGMAKYVLEKTGTEINGCTQCMLSCYQGEQRYDMHLDNPHLSQQEFPDNATRYTLAYYINPHWDPTEDNNAGGMDFYLTDPSED